MLVVASACAPWLATAPPTWSEMKAARLDNCKSTRPETGAVAAECMGEYLDYRGTRVCTDTRAWLARVGAGIPEG